MRMAQREVGGGESRRGFYVGIEHGLATAATVESSLFYVSHPTKCDVLLYSDPGNGSDRRGGMQRRYPGEHAPTASVRGPGSRTASAQAATWAGCASKSNI